MIPISFKFVAAGIATRAKGALYRFSPSREGQSPNWTNSDCVFSAKNTATPITDKSYWEGRYALCEVTLEKEDGETLVINDVVAGIRRQKNIVTTQMVGMDGTVKEYINNGDYQIELAVGVIAIEDGVIVDEYPESGIKELRKFLEDKNAIKVQSTFFDIFGIDRIVVTGFSVSQDTSSNYQEISVSALSDEEYNVYSTDY